ncbi:MAG: heavy metal translocating P-type ATPase, partial [Eubacteriaceae bacterium]
MFLKNWLSNEPKPTIFCTVVSAAALIFSLGRWLNTALPFDPAWIAIFLCGIPIVTGAANALIREHDVKADMLVSIALIASVFTREYFAAGEVALIMQIGSLLEDFTANRARRGIEGLIRMTPKTARLHRNGTSVIVPVEELKVGDIITVLAGETIPTDGVLTHGESSIDQSAMTGESIPVDKKAGDSVLSGTVNQYGTFEMKASKVCSDSSLQRMIALAEAADAGKAPIVSLADKWAGWMVFAALGCTALTWLLTGQFLRAVTVLVVFCPCAFILATPTAVAAAIGNLTRYGILIRTGDGLERLAAVDTVALDKTGTLTCGKPVVTSVETFDDSFSPADILKLAASCEQCSEHPLGKAIVSRFTEQGGLPEKATDIKILAGRGVRAQINGHTVIVGKPGLSDSDNLIGDSASATVSDNKSVIPLFPTDESHAALVQSCYDHGATVIFISVDGKAAGMVALADTVRSCSRETVEQLKAEQLTPVLLTGDNPAAAGTVARSLGISEYRSS